MVVEKVAAAAMTAAGPSVAGVTFGGPGISPEKAIGISESVCVQPFVWVFVWVSILMMSSAPLLPLLLPPSPLQASVNKMASCCCI